MMHGPIYTFLYWVVRFGLFLYHPIFKVVGRKRVPKTGRVLFCCNHSGLADPVWLVMALYKDHMPRWAGFCGPSASSASTGTAWISPASRRESSVCGTSSSC